MSLKVCAFGNISVKKNLSLTLDNIKGIIKSIYKKLSIIPIIKFEIADNLTMIVCYKYSKHCHKYRTV